jgi:predicted ATPase
MTDLELSERVESFSRDFKSFKEICTSKELGLKEKKDKVLLYEKAEAGLKYDYDTTRAAVDLISQVAEATIGTATDYLIDAVNSTLERVFQGHGRYIQLREYMRGNTPQLEVQIFSSNGIQRSIEDGVGAGIAQIIGLLLNLGLIVLTNKRRIVILDEYLTGLHQEAWDVLGEILTDFTSIGFQFLIVEHGDTKVIPGARVYELQQDNNLTRVIDTYIA